MEEEVDENQVCSTDNGAFLRSSQAVPTVHAFLYISTCLRMTQCTVCRASPARQDYIVSRHALLHTHTGTQYSPKATPRTKAVTATVPTAVAAAMPQETLPLLPADQPQEKRQNQISLKIHGQEWQVQ